ncbi:MAG: Na(+)/H(+) antiporter NhaA [Planctomycetota bacterium]|nr:MAG: Na(+)/H(+) antiporter NhaA [Planctomycetota bacterium]
MASGTTRERNPGRPGAWLPAQRLREALLGPLERFLHLQAASGIVLLAAAAAALVWANSPWWHSYERLWHTPLTLGVGSWQIQRDLHFWINEFLMTIFFLVAGLEIKRELAAGALSDLKRAALPVAAALGGMLAPALIYTALNPAAPARSGWGIPMATDIAFAVGVVVLLGRRVPPAVRVLLLAVAIIDDLGAILVIAIFYASGFDPQGLLVLGGGVAFMLLLRAAGVRPGIGYIFPLTVIWVGLYQTGVHPTIAGVIVAFATPVEPWLERRHFIELAQQALAEFQRRFEQGRGEHELLEPLRTLTQAGREAVSPAVRGEVFFHPWVAFLIMPLFALANAGVRLGELDLGRPGALGVLLGVSGGLVLGKPLGVLGLSWLAVRCGLCRLPRGVGWHGVALLGAAAGIGFTMAIFIAELAFTDPMLLNAAKLGVLLATALAALLAVALGRALALPPRPPAEELTESQIERENAYWESTGESARPEVEPVLGIDPRD